MCWCVNSDSAKKGQIFVDIFSFTSLCFKPEAMNYVLAVYLLYFYTV